MASDIKGRDGWECWEDNWCVPKVEKAMSLQNSVAVDDLHIAEDMATLQRTRYFGRIFFKNFKAYTAG